MAPLTQLLDLDNLGDDVVARFFFGNGSLLLPD
jgi:hypothetical protein